MWHAIQITHDKNFLRIMEEPMVEKVADKLNEIERTHGKITYVTEVYNNSDSWINLVVQTEN